MSFDMRAPQPTRRSVLLSAVAGLGALGVAGCARAGDAPETAQLTGIKDTAALEPAVRSNLRAGGSG